MFFLAFQEYVHLYTKEDDLHIPAERLVYYMLHYRLFCHEHHICDNLMDFQKEQHTKYLAKYG